MDLLAPDEANFNHLLQVDINIKPHINNMKKILSNSIEILIADSLSRAVEIHAQIPHLHFPFSKWSKYKQLDNTTILAVLGNMPIENYPQLIHDCVNVAPVKYFSEGDTIYNPFILRTLLSSQSKTIISSKGESFSTFQKDLLQAFVTKIPSYTKETALFAFIELTHFHEAILPENQIIFKQLSSPQLDKFLSYSFNNSFILETFFDKNNKFFEPLCSGFYDYLKSPNQNVIFDYLSEKIAVLDAFSNQVFPSLFPDEIEKIQRLKKEHEFLVLVLDNKLPSKAKSKQPKI